MGCSLYIGYNIIIRGVQLSTEYVQELYSFVVFMNDNRSSKNVHKLLLSTNFIPWNFVVIMMLL